MEIAARHSDVDANDLKAVQQWYMEVLPTLPHGTINEIFEELLDKDGTVADERIEPAYPKDVPLPSLSASPPAPVPMLAVGINQLLRKLVRRSKK